MLNVRFSFPGKKALITGSAPEGGIGYEIAKLFLESGASVVLHSHLSQSIALPNGVPTNAHFLQQDLQFTGELPSFFDKACDLLNGEIDYLILNAGVYKEPNLWDLKAEQLSFTVAINLLAPIMLTSRFAARCRAAGKGGRVVATTSVNADLSEPQHTGYDASKSGVNGFVRSAAMELAQQNILVNAVAPGLVATPITGMGFADDPDLRRSLEDQIPLGRIATPQELAAIYLFLCSDCCNQVTGSIWASDGGLGANQLSLRPISADGK